jgi:Phosphopantetheinyl transferase
MINGMIAPAPAVIDIWTLPLDRPATEVASLAALLSGDEHNRAHRFASPRHADRFIVARANLRIILGNRLGIPAHDLTFGYNAFGKPYLTDDAATPLHFNLSHSGSFAMLALSDRIPVGIDIEEMKPLKEDIAGYFFSARERVSLRRLPPDGYLQGFYRCWTRKEALVKGRGDGLTTALDSFDVSIGRQATVDLSRLDKGVSGSDRWKLWNLSVPTGFEGALAALVDERPVQLRYHADPGSDPAFMDAAAHPSRSDRQRHRSDGTRSALV